MFIMVHDKSDVIDSASMNRKMKGNNICENSYNTDGRQFFSDFPLIGLL